ncbi:hypothetical protein K7A41_01550 [Sphingobacterium sp. InxBP1]|uniref:hypothetical protein n=1 Tax=Sphingobacterium sp. InxBP1 TaxID=2870328 RepID=UPI002242ECA1|nr:hypothetical protein [Sphingobacterium sp. InxBP1]MCW8309901.1 hypothetical protein [Sphingobacterium sp. InxBP1]
MYKFKAKVLISKKPTCNCGGFYHPGDVFTETNEQKAKRYIAKDWVDVLESPVAEKEEKQVRKTKEYKG